MQNLNFFDGEAIPNYREIWDNADSILLSNSKSGSTWLRFCIEFLSQRPTVGWGPNQNTLAIINLPLFSQIEYEKFNGFINRKAILAKTHEAGDIEMFVSEPSKLVLLLRNYKELICRPDQAQKHFPDSFEEYIPSNKEIKDRIERNALPIIESYAEKLEFYDNFEGKKLIVFYEDLIKDFKSVMIDMINFLELGDLGHSNLERILEDFSDFKNLGISSYKNLPHIQLGALVDERTNNFCRCRRSDKTSYKSWHNTVFASLINLANEKKDICRLLTSEYYYDSKTKEIFLQFRDDMQWRPGRDFTSHIIKADMKQLALDHEDSKKRNWHNFKTPLFPDEFFLIIPNTAIFVIYYQEYNAYTAKSGDIHQHANEILNQSEKIEIDSIIKEVTPNLFKKYLKRYEEKNDDNV
jgi:hypothetical protein